ncbi:YIP1 family protein [Massilia niabensis]|uniref:YIP1 family protein n=1 Tax=Massilia niabensis TaxID=544910 RepID=A0ABW0L4I4_9BURK
MELTNNAPTVGASPASAFTTMLYEPTATFQRLEAKPRGWFPTILLMVSTAALTLWYFSMVDFAWLLDQMLAIMKPEEREQAAKFMSRNMMQISSLVSSLLMLPLFFALLGVYLMIVSKALSHGISFGKGFALAAWSSVPAILLFPLGAMQILMASGGQLSFSELNPVSLNQLLFHYDMTHPLSTLMDTLNLTTFWNIFLLVIGFQVWAKVKRSTAILVVLVPFALIYGGWFAYGMSKVA